MQRIRKGDFVQVMTGKDRGRTGQILDVLGDRVIVERVNVVKRHQKASQSGGPSGIVEKSLPIHISNVMPFDAKAKKPSRIRVKIADGTRTRIYAASGEEVEVAKKAK